jgi:hypothetical protein
LLGERDEEPASGETGTAPSSPDRAWSGRS